MTTFETICEIIAEVLDIEPDTLSMNTYVMRDLATESIDLLEYGVGLNARFCVPVQDSIVFLQDFRIHVIEAERQNEPPYKRLKEAYPHLDGERITEMLADLEGGAVMQIRDIVSYIEHARGEQ